LKLFQAFFISFCSLKKGKKKKDKEKIGQNYLLLVSFLDMVYLFFN